MHCNVSFMEEEQMYSTVPHSQKFRVRLELTDQLKNMGQVSSSRVKFPFWKLSVSRSSVFLLKSKQRTSSAGLLHMRPPGAQTRFPLTVCHPSLRRPSFYKCRCWAKTVGSLTVNVTPPHLFLCSSRVARETISPLHRPPLPAAPVLASPL